MRNILTFAALLITPLLLSSCGDPDPDQAPTRKTPTGAKVDLTGVTLNALKPTITKKTNGKYELRFDYTLENTSGSNIEFPNIYASMDDLIEVNLSDKKGDPIVLDRRLLDGLTLTQPRPRRIPVGKTTRSYAVNIAANALKASDPVNVRIRLHAPSRYDELRTSLEALPLTLKWPGKPEQEKP